MDPKASDDGEPERRGTGFPTDLKAIVERCIVASSKEIASTPSDGLILDASIPNGYVWPSLTNWHGSDEPAIVLIDAPGAVGKSAGAGAVAGTLNWPLVNAAFGQVGSWGLSGLIHGVLGLDTTFFADLARARTGLVVDALDEGHLRAGTANFLEYISNVVQLSAANASITGFIGPQIFLFSRPDTADIVELALQTGNASYARCSLDFFDRARAEQYITTYMRIKSEQQAESKAYGIAVSSPEPFAKLRDQRLLQIASILVPNQEKFDWTPVQDFLGYAPVLSVIAETLAVTNPSKELTNANLTANGTRSVLLQIVENLLSREQSKFSLQMSSKLNSLARIDENVPRPDQLYSPDEQVVRLSSKVFGVEIGVDLPGLMAESVRAQYEKAATQFMADHPFLNNGRAINSVISDYLSAKALLDPTCRAALHPAVSERQITVGPFFYRFANDFGSLDDNDTSVVPERVLPLLLRSFQLSRSAASQSIAAVLQFEEDTISCTLGLGSLDGRLDFTIDDLSGVLEFYDHLSNIIVISRLSSVIFGTTAGRFILGPNATVSCQELQINATTLSIDPGRPPHENPSVLNAVTITTQGNLEVDAPRAEAFIVQTEDPWPVFRAYRHQSTFEFPPAPRALVDIRAILIAFRQGAGKQPGVYYELLEQRIVGLNPDRRRYLSGLIAMGIISRQSNHYYLDLNTLGAREISLRMVDLAEPNSQLTQLLRDLDVAAPPSETG